jgi:hypothetical protein
LLKINDEIMENYISYIKESFSFPLGQNFPIDYFEIKPYLIIGDGNSKTELAISELALNAYEVWRDKIDFFIVRDNINALIDGLLTSKKVVHYIVLNGNVLHMNGFYFTLFHELKTRIGLILGGIIICALLVQSYRDIDLRLRHNMMFTISNWKIDFDDEKYKNLPFKFVKIKNKEV